MSGDGSLTVVCAAGDVPDGEGRTFSLDGLKLAVFNLGGTFYVIDDMCTHGPGSLGEGFVEGDEVECDFHQGRFHIPTGKPAGAPCTEPVRTWEVRLVDGKVMVDLDAPRIAE